MYEEYFGLVEPPFDLSTDPRFLYMSPAHARAKAYLDYAVYKGDGLVVITGEIGVGKSTLIHELVAAGHNHADVVVIRQPQSDTIDFLQAWLLQWGAEQPPATRAALLAAVSAELCERFMWGRRTTLIIDEAQTLGRDLLEELRMLADAQIGAQKPLAIVLVGQPCLRERLAGAAMEQFRQRVRLSFHLSPLDRDETRIYVNKRLEVAGASPGPWPIFRDDAVALIYQYTGGVPRLINVLADLALTAAYLEGTDSVAEQQVANAVEELGWVSYARRRRQAALALPGLSWRARAAATAAQHWSGVRHESRRLASALGCNVREVRDGLSARVRQARAANAGASSLAAAKAGGLTAAFVTRMGQAKTGLAGLPAALRSRLHDRAWIRAHLGRGVAVLFIAVLTAGVVISGNHVETAEHTVAIPAVVATADPAGAEQDPSFSAHASAKLSSESSGSASRMDYIAMGEPPRVTLRPTRRFRSDQTASQSAPVATDTTADGVVAQPAASPAAAAAPGVHSATTPLADDPLAVGLADAGWLLEQDSGQYVVQVFAARSPDVVERFLAGRAGEMELAYYRRVQGPDQWHVLVTGPYSSYPNAKKASAAFPAEVRKAGPWVRSLAEVQDDIRAANRELQARVLP